MKSDEIIKDYKGKATYQILVWGKVDPKFIRRHINLSVTHTESKDRTLSTLTGEIEDQEALSGLINMLIDHQYKVVSVMNIEA